MTSDNHPDELPTKGPEVSSLMTWNDAIWSPNFAEAALPEDAGRSPAVVD